MGFKGEWKGLKGFEGSKGRMGFEGSEEATHHS
jgi:hypothetical protein